MHTLGPLNAPIQSEAVIELSESDFDSETSQMAPGWLGFTSRSFVSEKTSGFQGMPCLTLPQK